ncbi:hypothetical protein LCGC14_0495360 [marine sediment metagenome]|uniref:Uncharacterized protein n=1 Tax=marine sediment metagenome TaxID=412755 RepID=A0A0F9SAN1_9ZZZZ|nr:hypothetical protein [bacterium]
MIDLLFNVVFWIFGDYYTTTTNYDPKTERNGFVRLIISKYGYKYFLLFKIILTIPLFLSPGGNIFMGSLGFFLTINNYFMSIRKIEVTLFQYLFLFCCLGILSIFSFIIVAKLYLLEQQIINSFI